MGSALDLLHGPSLVVSVKPYAGLGNRVRVLLSAQSLAEWESRSFAYCWPTGAPFGARLTDLWQVQLPKVPPLVARAMTVRYRFHDEHDGWRQAARGDRVWQIRTSQPVALPPEAVPWQARLRNLVPVEPVAERVQTFFDRHLHGRPYVGVMIRAHEVSHALSREHSPVDWFVARMREIRSARPETAFFVSCDVPEVQDRIVAEFGPAFGLTDKGGYNTKAALTSAVVDLYLLASSSHVLGPHYSSFPELAVFLAGDRIALETSATPRVMMQERSAMNVVRDPLCPWST